MHAEIGCKGLCGNLATKDRTVAGSSAHAASKRHHAAILSRPNFNKRCMRVGCATGALTGHGSSTPIRATAPPSNAMFFVKLIMSFMRCSGSALCQKLCMMGDTPARNPAIAAVPSFGFTPSRMLAPPATIAAPVRSTARSGMGTFFDLVASIMALRSVK